MIIGNTPLRGDTRAFATPQFVTIFLVMYEDRVISQYTIVAHDIKDQSVVPELGRKPDIADGGSVLKMQ